MKKTFRIIGITFVAILFLFLILSTSSKMAVRTRILVSGNPVYAIKSDPSYDRDGSETYSAENKTHGTIYTTSLKYAIYPDSAGGNPVDNYNIHKYWIFKIAEPVAV